MINITINHGVKNSFHDVEAIAAETASLLLHCRANGCALTRARGEVLDYKNIPNCRAMLSGRKLLPLDGNSFRSA
jgi:hypothetical protein